MAKPHDQELNDKGPSAPGLISGPYGSAPYAQEHGEKGLHTYYWQKWVFTHYYMIVNGLLARFGRFSPFLEDLGTFLRPDLGGKLGVCYQIKAYINQRFLAAWKEVQNRKMMKNC